MKASPQDRRFLLLFLLGWLILEILVVAIVGRNNNLDFPALLIIAAGFIASTLLAALLTYLVARLMNVL
jgi:peptidoglycan/LPS O-acetylase OafA/YrhL